MNVIGLHGKKRRGKDTVAKFAAELLGGDYKLISPADKLKQLLCEALGIPYKDSDDAVRIMEDCKDHWTITVTSDKPWDPGTDGSKHRLVPNWLCKEPVTTISGRQLQQYAGNGARGVFGEHFWIDQVLPPATVYGSEDMERTERMHGLCFGDTLFIPSVRYINEAQRVHDYGGPVIEVIRPGLPEDDSFISEQRLPPEFINYTIVNDGGLSDLYNKTREALQHLEMLPA